MGLLNWILAAAPKNQLLSWGQGPLSPLLLSEVPETLPPMEIEKGRNKTFLTQMR